VRSPRDIIVHGVLVGVLAAGIGAGALLAYVSWYARTDRIFPGVIVGSVPLGGLHTPEARARLAARERLPVMSAGASPTDGLVAGERPRPTPFALRLRWGEREWPLELVAVGGLPDVPGALRSATAIGRTGSAWTRTRTYLDGLVHGHRVTLQTHISDDLILQRLRSIAAEVSDPAADPGLVEPAVLDMPASVSAIRQAILAGRPDADLVGLPVGPVARQPEPVQAPASHLMSRFTTPVLAADPGRMHNITTAVQKIDGAVIAPGQVFSFNDIVGPRDAAHGWAPAKELYQGEFVMGYGGGICQVSSTLYNTVLLAGLEVRERFHHDRPLQYVAPGRDATVAWNVLDFKFRNSASVPVTLGAHVLPGSPAQIEVVLRAASSAVQGQIRIEDAEIQYIPPPMVEVLDPILPADEREVIDEGMYGIELKVFRVLQDGGVERRELVSHDHYRPKPGRVRVGVGNAPGTQRLLNPGVH